MLAVASSAGAAAAAAGRSERKLGRRRSVRRRRPGCAVDRVWCAGGVFAEIVDDRAGGGERLVMIVEAEAGEFGDAELFAEDAGGVVVLEDPVVEAGFDAAGAVEQGIFCGVEELLRAGE